MNNNTSIESIRAEIDNVLLSLYNAKTEGFTYVNLKLLFRAFLSAAVDKRDEYLSLAKKYYAVLDDLSEETIQNISQVVAVDLKKKKAIVKTTTVYHGLNQPIRETEQLIDILPGREDYYTSIDISNNEINLPRSPKYMFYLEGAKIENEEGWVDFWCFLKSDSEMQGSKKEYELLFNNYGFKEADTQYSFESYIDEIEVKQSQFEVADLTPEETALLEQETKRFMLLKKLGVLDSLWQSFGIGMGNGKFTSFICFILGIEIKKETVPGARKHKQLARYIRNLINGGSKDISNNPDKEGVNKQVLESLKSFGITQRDLSKFK
jgi:hypothetical protein